MQGGPSRRSCSPRPALNPRYRHCSAWPQLPVTANPLLSGAATSWSQGDPSPLPKCSTMELVHERQLQGPHDGRGREEFLVIERSSTPGRSLEWFVSLSANGRHCPYFCELARHGNIASQAF